MISAHKKLLCQPLYRQRIPQMAVNIPDYLLGQMCIRDRALATALCPALGYKKSAEIAKKCNRTGIPVRQIVLEEGLLPEEELDRYLSLVDMTQAGHPVDYKL